MRSENLFWEKTTCLITGALGFIGSHLCAKLYNIGARVIAVDIEPYHDKTMFYFLNKDKKINIINKDLSNPDSIEEIQATKPNIIFHLAAIPYAPYTSLNPLEAYRSNVVTTTIMLELARRVCADQFVLASSACVFGAAQSSPLSENDKLYPPQHFYSYTKREAEEQVRAFNEFYGVPSSICRMVNVYGPGDRHFGRIIPQIIRQLIIDKAITLKLLRSQGKSIFEFLYVDDAIEGLLATAKIKSNKTEVYHFGPGRNGRLSILDLVKKLSQLYDGKIREVSVNNVAPERTVYKYLRVENTKNILRWSSKIYLDYGLNLTLKWYEKNINKITPRKY